MGRHYYIPLISLVVSATGVTDIFYIHASGCGLCFKELKLTQQVSETSEQLPLLFFLTSADNTAGGTAGSANPTHPLDPAFRGTVRLRMSGASASSQTLPLFQIGENVLNGWHWQPTPEGYLYLNAFSAVPAGSAVMSRLAVAFPTAPVSALTVAGYALVEEMT